MQIDAGLVLIEYTFDDRQSQTRALGASGEKGFKQFVLFPGDYATTVIADLDAYARAARTKVDHGLDRNSAVWYVLGRLSGIGDEIRKYLA